MQNNERPHIAVIHQPYFLPWLGYFNKLAYADHFVVLDNVQYRNRYYHNRVNIKDMHGQRHWVTLPIGSNYRKMIDEVQVVDRKGMLNIFKTVEYSYVKTKYFVEYWSTIRVAIEEGFPSLVQINVNAIRVLLHILGLSQLNIWMASNIYSGRDATERLINTCLATGSTMMIMGQGGSYEYHDLARIKGAGIEILVQRFLENHPIYPQSNGPFLDRLSVIDTLFNIGAKRTLEIIKQAWSPYREDGMK